MPDTNAHPPSAIPQGFTPISSGGAFIANNGPIYHRLTEAGVVFGFRVEERHCNPLGIAHGGWLSTMADMALPLGARHAAALDHYLLTMHLSLDFMSPAKLGEWVTATADLLRRTRSSIFAQGLLRVEDRVVLRASGIFRIGPEAGGKDLL